jgi:hypothetical protein
MQEREFSNLGEMLGMGFDSLQEKLCPNSAIDLSKINEETLQKEQEKLNQQDMFYFKHIKNQEMLAEQFNISGSLSGQGIVAPLLQQFSINLTTGINHQIKSRQGFCGLHT